MAPPSVQIHCHLSTSHPEKLRAGGDDALRLLSNTGGCSRFEKVPMYLSMLGKGKKGSGDKKDRGNGKDNASATAYFAVNCLRGKAWGHMEKDCWCSENSQEREGHLWKHRAEQPVNWTPRTLEWCENPTITPRRANPRNGCSL